MNQFKKNQTSKKEEQTFVSANKTQNETSLRSDQKIKQKKQKKLVDMEGFVTHNLSNGKFRLKLENGVEVIGHLSGKIRQNRIKIVVGDKVTVELSPYDLTKGRITYRHR
jgi:translation initiation factor IF-1|uniref:Translation initiation factor IF-1, chloroplastic n=1 Tax=Hariotina reticulata TaxID=183314 RepID=A0A2R4PAQ7_9CHLO|nr:translation initiation factor 1 [Hariotina reticulata]